jgi:hypothetical protein
MDNESLVTIANTDFFQYLNTFPVLRVGGVDFYMSDVIKAGLSAKMNIGLLGDTGLGKTQLERDMMVMFGNNAGYVLGRNDLDIKQVFRKLRFDKLVGAMNQGGEISASDITEVTEAIYKPLTVIDEINRCVEAVQNQLFNIFDGYLEIDGVIHPLGTNYSVITKSDGSILVVPGLQPEGQNGDDSKIEVVTYSVGICSANYGNGKFTGTSTMDGAMKDRLHILTDVDNFIPENPDLDAILFNSSGEVRTKTTNAPSSNLIDDFVKANLYLKDLSKRLHPEEFMYFRYLIKGLDYIPVPSANNSKRIMKEVWPMKVEADGIGSGEEEIIMYRMVSPLSIRGALVTINYARALREYAIAKDPQAKPTILESVMAAYRMTSAYTNLTGNPTRLNEDYVGNPYRAAKKVAEIMESKLSDKMQLIKDLTLTRKSGKPIPASLLSQCTGEFECWK